jgi:hypothetical protein
MYACRYGNVNMLKLLIDHKFKLENYQKKNYSLIHSACFGHNLEVLRFLVNEIKLDVNP